MNTFQPRRVDSEAPRRWLREALALMARRPLAYLASTALVLGLFLAALQVESLLLAFLLVLFLPPLTVLGFTRLAEASDRSNVFSASALLPSNGEAGKVLALALTGYCVIFAPLLVLGAGAEALGGEGILSVQAQWQAQAEATVAGLGVPLHLYTQSFLFGASLVSFAGLLLGMGAWFSVPLVAFQGMPLVQACLLSLQACRLNAAPLRFSSFLAMMTVLLAVIASFGLLAVALAPLLGTVLYVSYRDVFLGRAVNAPALAQADPAATAAAGG